MPTMKGKTKFESAACSVPMTVFIGQDPKLVEQYEEEVINAEIARRIYDLRTKARLSQRELAKKVGTTASVIPNGIAPFPGASLAV